MDPCLGFSHPLHEFEGCVGVIFWGQGMDWRKVVSRRPSLRWDVFPFGGMNRGVAAAAVTSFYVSEFPDFVNAKRLYELFGCSGSVVEVAISPRRNRIGKRYAFARFLGVDDGRILAVRLDNIMIEGTKIHVNLPRFSRANGLAAGRQVFVEGPAKFKKVASAGDKVNTVGACRGNFVSYAEVVGSKYNEDPILLHYQSNFVLKSRFEKAFIGRVCIPGTAYNIQNYLEMEGIFAIKVTPLGGNTCLLEEKEDGFISDLIREGETWWKEWFSEIKRWEAGMVDGRRDAWFRVYGIPIHVWSTEFFMSLGEKWGRFICIDENTAKGEVFDVARIMVNIPLSLCMPDCVSVSIDGVVVNLCIREDSMSYYRQVAGNMKGVNSADESTELSESDSERYVLDSDSVCSGDSAGTDERELFHSAHVGTDQKVEDVQQKVNNGNAGSVQQVGDSGTFDGQTEVELEGARHFIVCSESRLGPDSVSIEEDTVSKVSKSSDVNSVHQVEYSSREQNNSSKIKMRDSGTAVLYSTNAVQVSAESGESVTNVKTVFSNSDFVDITASKRNCTDDILSLQRKSVGEFEAAGPSANIPRRMLGTGVGISINSSTLGPHSGSVHGEVGYVVHCEGSDSGRGGNGIVLPNRKVADGEFSLQRTGYVNGVTGVRKKFRKITLNRDNCKPGKGKGKVKSIAGKVVKGVSASSVIKADRSIHLNGSRSTCYGDQSEESDIRRNNGRQWDILKREVGDRLWEAIIALGVVDTEGRNLRFRGTKLVNDGGRENNKGVK